MPFTQDQFLGIFSLYNLSVWPAQVLLNTLALFSVFLLFKKYSFSNKLINLILSFFWIWMGIVYHIIFFSTINPAAVVFGILFIVQGLLFFFIGVMNNKLIYEYTNSYLSVIGTIFILYALFIYPYIGLIVGHSYPSNPTFGCPCPTTIFSFGILLFSVKKIPFYIFLIPFLWSLLGFSAAISLSIYEDIGLIIAGFTSFALILFSINKRDLSLGILK